MPPQRFLLAWVVATVGGLAFVGALGHYPSISATENLTFDYPAATFGFILGGISGVIVGVPQWLLLRRRWRVGWWVPALMLGFGLRHALGDGATYSANPGLNALVAALLLTLLQGLMLRRQSPGPWHWALASLAGSLVGYAVAMSILTATGLMDRAWTPGFGAIRYALFAGIEGLVYGVATGVVLGWSPMAQPQARAETARAV